MASGQSMIIKHPADAVLPQSVTTTPVPDRRNDQDILVCDAGQDDEFDLPIVVPEDYAGGGMTAKLFTSATTATTGVARWSLQWERHQDDAFDTDADGFATALTVDVTAPSASGEISEDDIAFTDGAQIDSIAAGEIGRIRCSRVGTHANDTMAAGGEFRGVSIRET